MKSKEKQKKRLQKDRDAVDGLLLRTLAERFPTCGVGLDNGEWYVTAGCSRDSLDMGRGYDLVDAYLDFTMNALESLTTAPKARKRKPALRVVK